MNQRRDRSGPRNRKRITADQPGPSAPGTIGQACEVLDDLADELLIDGQEEVFSRTEVESGCFEHHVGEERAVPVSPSRPTTPE